MTSAAPCRTLVDGHAQDHVSALDRGLSYGDGLFETVRFVGSDAPLWARHMQRLATSCPRLALPVPDATTLLREAREAIGERPQAIARITLTRGIGTRGYAPSGAAPVTRIVAGFEMPVLRAEDAIDGLRVRRCALRLAEQPALAGMKHLNRLEQVLARAEWQDPTIAEGLLGDCHGRVISATAANLFAVIDGALATPALEQCGIAGVARAEVLARLPQTRVRDIGWDELDRASEIFLCSSVRGILPVGAVDARAYTIGPVTRAMQRYWRGLGFLDQAFPMEQAG
jgi:4-amino-4-deoxychorismate lyase